MSDDGPDPLHPDEIADWVADASEAAEALADALQEEAAQVSGDQAGLAEARAERDTCLALFGEIYEALEATPGWIDALTARETQGFASALDAIRSAARDVERACLAERAAHEVMVSHVRNVLRTGGEMTAYARTGIARRAPDGPISVSLNGRH
ncbi:hypothetical protein CKO28_16070 [Rhodovibrio sodomensis]|uniref:Flagellar protein FlgN n=1 Tax=Rhodovibrio sodomensis TaxID=1088 RepID=A0ABS1DGF8_9PROT|nr:hypothetical protein [Rhodovibrio sodomensis]MBK1669556.1 hypothetical protein [Rhodovibrio sodomensis]